MAKQISPHTPAVRYPKPLPAALRNKIKKVADSTKGESHSGGDSVTLSLKKPRPGSDMDVMLNDLKRNDALPKKPETPRPKPHEGSEMAEMLANIDKTNSSFAHTQVQVSSTGTLALLEEPVTPASQGPKEKVSRSEDALSGTGVAIEGVEHAGNGASGYLEMAGEVAEQGTQLVDNTARSLGATALDTVVQGASVLSGALVLPLALRGSKLLRQGVKEGDLDKKLDGANNIAVGVRSGATGVSLAGLTEGGKFATQAAEVAGTLASGLGVATAAVDGVLGVREFIKGKKVDGALRVGFAVGVGAAALGAGPVATVGAAGFLTARVVRKVAQIRKQRGEAKA